MSTAQPWWVASIAGDGLRRNASIEARDLWHVPSLWGYAEILRPKGIFDRIQSTAWRVTRELNISLAAIPTQTGLSLPSAAFQMFPQHHVMALSIAEIILKLRCQECLGVLQVPTEIQAETQRSPGTFSCIGTNQHSKCHLLLKHDHSTSCIFSVTSMC